MLPYSTKEETKAYEGKRLSRLLSQRSVQAGLEPRQYVLKSQHAFPVQSGWPPVLTWSRPRTFSIMRRKETQTDEQWEARVEGLCHPSRPEARSGRGSREWSRSAARQPGLPGLCRLHTALPLTLLWGIQVPAPVSTGYYSVYKTV